MRTSPDALVLGSNDPAEIDRLNDALEKEVAGRPLGPGLPVGSRLVVPVDVTKVDAAGVIVIAGKAGLDIPLLEAPSLFSGTLKLLGKSIGHGFKFAEVSIDDQPVVPWEKPPAGLRRPVVALLDSGVRDHPWLPHVEGDPFLIDAEQHSDPWRPGLRDAAEAVADDTFAADEVPHDGHATFLAGLIRQGAPSARVLSIRLMNHKGEVNEARVGAALRWLRDKYIDDDHPVDVLCMAFGRVPGDELGTAALSMMSEPLQELAALGVRIVASAGNDHQDEVEIFPAAFPVVTSVGAGSGPYHAKFSNYGDWVDRNRDGVETLSILPGAKWGRWSGTSFAAANYAADLARPHVV